MKRFTTAVLALCLAAGLAAAGCSKKQADTPKDSGAAVKQVEKPGVIESKEIETFGKSFCDAIGADPYEVMDFMAMKFVFRIGLEVTMTPEKKAEMEAQGMTMEMLTDMGANSLDTQRDKFAKLGKDIGQCKVDATAETACSAIVDALAADGFMGKKKLDAQVSAMILGAFNIERCGAMRLSNDEGEAGAALLGVVEGQWKILSVAKD
jgi:hypothetical protein